MTVNPMPTFVRASSALAMIRAFIWFMTSPYDGGVTEFEFAPIRPLNVSDIDEAVELNNAEIPHVGPTDPEHLAGFLRTRGWSG